MEKRSYAAEGLSIVLRWPISSRRERLRLQTARRFVDSPMRQQHPDLPRHLVRKGHGGHVVGPTLDQAAQPGIGTSPCGAPDQHASGAVNEQAAQ